MSLQSGRISEAHETQQRSSSMTEGQTRPRSAEGLEEEIQKQTSATFLSDNLSNFDLLQYITDPGFGR